MAVAHPEAPTGAAAPRPRTRPVDSSASWPLRDRVGLALCWAAGLALCLICAAIVLFLTVKGLESLRLSWLVEHPTADLDQSKSGGFLDPIVGTFLLTAVGMVIAAPLGVAIAVWLTEYARPAWLARAVESGVEIVAGTPSIVLAIFGLIVFSNTALGFLSAPVEGASAFGRSFLIAGAMMALLALPLVIGSVREALHALPGHLREASYALGKTKATTIRKVLLPAIRPGIATGGALGTGRIIGDTAIVIVLLGGTLQIEGAGGLPILSTLRGTGQTLTSYVYNNSPAGEGNAPEKAYAAAFVLMLVIIALNWVVDRLAKGQEGITWIR